MGYVQRFALHSKIIKCCSAYQVDCSRIDEKKDPKCLPKFLRNQVFQNSTIRFEFPKENNPPYVADLSLCETASFFRDIEETQRKLNILRKNVTIYSVKFDLNNLDQYTNSTVTEFVTIRADTVYMTGSLSINFNLTIIARTISISHPITLIYDRNQYGLPIGVKPIEQRVQINDLLEMRWRKFGFLELLDQYQPKIESYSKCMPQQTLSQNLDIKNWFDSRFVNMMYICGYAMLTNDPTSETVHNIINFVLNFYSRKTDVQDFSTYISAQKYLKLKMRQETSHIHKVPDYVYDEIKTLSDATYKHLNNYNRSIHLLKKDLSNLRSNMVDIKLKFDLAEAEINSQIESEKHLIKLSIATSNITWLAHNKERLDQLSKQSIDFFFFSLVSLTM